MGNYQNVRLPEVKRNNDIYAVMNKTISSRQRPEIKKKVAIINKTPKTVEKVQMR